MRAYYVYIPTSVNRKVMYVGVTNNLENRVAEHRSRKGSAFTRRYRVNVLVGKDAGSARIASSFFLTADGEGNILASSPKIVRLY